MSALELSLPPAPVVWPATAAFVAGLVLLGLERRGRAGIGPVAALGALALGVALVILARLAWAPLAVGLVVALLARDGDEVLHGECAIKLLWVMGGALALSFAGLELLTVATGTPVTLEQWAVLDLGLEPRFLWSTALALSLLVGLVLLGGAPFHFWVADVFQGVRPWLAPLAVAALQVVGAAWIAHRLDGIEAYAPGAELARSLLRIAAITAFLAGAATLMVQRRPERRVGTLASLQGALVLARVASELRLDPALLDAWAGHLVLGLVGASTLARFLPISSPHPTPGAPLMRRHPAAAFAGLYALFSLAGVPGTPGAWLWLATARSLIQTGQAGLMLAISAAWLAALTVVMRQLHEAFGTPRTSAAVRPVPVRARRALWIAGLGLVALAWTWIARI